MQLQYPWLGLVCAVLLAVVAALHRWRPALIAGGAFGSTRERITPSISSLLLAAAMVVGSIAIMNPRYGESIEKVQQAGVAIANVVDTSLSMEAIDFGAGNTPLSRMDGAKKIVRNFAGSRGNDQQALIAFGEHVFTMAPLTADRKLLVQMADQLETGIAGSSTALGDALGIAVKRLRDVPMESKVIVALSDGESNMGSLLPLEAAALAKDNNIKIYTIGIGTNGFAPFKVNTLFGEKIESRKVTMDEATLQSIARLTGGLYFNATDVIELSEVYAKIDALERTDFESESVMYYHDQYLHFLWIAMLLAIAAIGWSAIVERRVPA